MYDRSYASPNRTQDHFSSTSLTRQESVSTLTFDDVPSSAASHMGNADGTRPSLMDLNEVGHHQCHHNRHLENNPSWMGGIVSADHQRGAVRAISNEQLKQFNHRMAVMTETTLEEFFANAGLIKTDDSVGYTNGDDANQQLQQMDQDPMTLALQRPAAVCWQQMVSMSSKMEATECSSENRGDSGFEVGFVERGVGSFGVPMAGGISGGSPSDSGVVTDKKRKCTDEVFDKTVERRKKRMIKNRESAARSRARKQAYTDQLEAEVAHLQKANNLLRKQKEEELLFKPKLDPGPRYQLRRTSSAQF